MVHRKGKNIAHKVHLLMLTNSYCYTNNGGHLYTGFPMYKIHILKVRNYYILYLITSKNKEIVEGKVR